MKIKIINSGENFVSIIKEMTEEQYYFLLSIVEDLDAEHVRWAPLLKIEPLD